MDTTISTSIGTKMLINEILDKKVRTKLKTNTPRTLQIAGTVNGREIMFTAHMSEENEKNNYWDVTFLEVKSNPNGVKYGSYKLTGSGGELQVFSMIKDCMMELIQKHNPAKIIFTANKDAGKDKNARGDVYERLIKRFKAPGYELQRSAAKTTSSNGFMKGTTTRKYDHFELVKTS